MAEVTPDDLASVEADNETKRSVLAALKAAEATVVTSPLLDARYEQLKSEGALLDRQIDEKLEVIAGHASIASTDLAEAKRLMRDAVEAQVEQAAAATDEAVSAARIDVDEKAQADADRTEAQAKADAEEERASLEDRVKSIIAAGAQSPVEATHPLPVPPIDLIPPTPSVKEGGAPSLPVSEAGNSDEVKGS